MNLIIADKYYYLFDLPPLKSKKSKNQTVTFLIIGEFTDQEVSDVVVAKGSRYQWVFKGCKLVKKNRLKSGHFFTDRYTESDLNKTELTIMFEERTGSHLQEVINSEIRDWSISKIID